MYFKFAQKYVLTLTQKNASGNVCFFPVQPQLFLVPRRDMMLACISIQ